MKNFLLSILSITTLLGSTCVWAQVKNEVIEQYEIRSYDPQKNGLTDLVFEARIDNLTEILNKTQTFGKLVDVYFKIYWLSPSQYKIEVMGLPKGFQEVRDDLSTLIKGKLEFIIPEKFSEKFKGYTLKAEPVADGKLIKAIDDSYTLAVPEVDLVFDNNGRLKTLQTKTPASSVKTDFFQTPKAWSNNKLVMDKVVSVNKQGIATNTITNSFEYITIGGMGFPSKLTVKNLTEATIPANGKEKEKKIKNETNTAIRFSKYEVNSGKALRFMTEGLRR
jgi:hypothetical protein